MDRQNYFSNVTNAYLYQYYEILDKMVHKMTGIEAESSISGYFISQILPHHEAAVEMARNILQYTTHIKVQDIAETILSTQTKNIADLQAIRPACETPINTRQEIYLYQKSNQRIIRTMFYEMQNAQESNNINADFLRELIPHHTGAVRMAENALRFHICPQLAPVLHTITHSQTSGMRTIQQILARLTRA